MNPCGGLSDTNKIKRGIEPRPAVRTFRSTFIFIRRCYRPKLTSKIEDRNMENESFMKVARALCAGTHYSDRTRKLEVGIVSCSDKPFLGMLLDYDKPARQ